MVRVHALSSHRRSGTVTIDKPGYSFKITFSEPFDVVCMADFIADQPVTARELLSRALFLSAGWGADRVLTLILVDLLGGLLDKILPQFSFARCYRRSGAL